MNVLRIDSSVRTDNSRSRQLTDFFLGILRKQGNWSLKVRDVGINQPALPTDEFVKANYTIPENRTKEMKQTLEFSDTLIDELFWANKIIIVSPMYNFSNSTALKAYVDSVVGIGRTFYIDDNGQMKGLLKDKKVLVITSRGAMSYKKGGALEGFDFQENYLRCVLQFMGISDITFVHTEAQDFGSEKMKMTNFETSKEQLSQLALQW